MAIIQEVRGKHPEIGANCFLAENSVIVGDVVMGEECSIWFGAVLRGDVNSISIGKHVNIQDNAVVHGTYEKYATKIGDNVSIGHGAVVHGCTIGNHVLVGMGAIVMDGTVVQDNVIIAAGSVVTKNSILESGGVYAGTPAKKIKEAGEMLLKGEVERIADAYSMYAGWYKK